VTAFRYRAARADGEIVAGVLEAASGPAATSDLTVGGLFPIEVAEAGREGRPRAWLPRADLAVVFGGLAALLEAGLPLDRALAATEESVPPRLAPVFAETRRRVREGASLSRALQAAGGLPDVALGLLRAGEAHGRLAAAARRVAGELEREAELVAQLRAALAYPLFLAVVGGLSVTLIVTVVVPRFAALLGDLGRAVPVSTRLLLGLSSTLAHHGPLALVLAGAVAALVARALSLEPGRAALHRWLLGVPVVGRIRWGLATARACRALAGLLETGVPLLAALDLAREAAGDRAVAERLTRARQSVSEGERLASALRRHEVVTPGALRLARFGEESGRLAELLGQAGRLEEAAAHRALRTLVGLLEPLLIVGFGAVVAFVAAALLQAVYSVRPAGY
jgi:type II secretory pathway component PulF